MEVHLRDAREHDLYCGTLSALKTQRSCQELPGSLRGTFVWFDNNLLLASVCCCVPVEVRGSSYSTQRQHASTLAGRLVIVQSRVMTVCALPLDIQGKLRTLRTMFMHAAFHGVEASLVAQSSLTKLRSAFVSSVWSRRMPLASFGAILSLLDGGDGDPGFHVVSSRFRMTRQFLAYQPCETTRINHMLHHVSLEWSYSLVC